MTDTELTVTRWWNASGGLRIDRGTRRALIGELSARWRLEHDSEPSGQLGLARRRRTSMGEWQPGLGAQPRAPATGCTVDDRAPRVRLGRCVAGSVDRSPTDLVAQGRGHSPVRRYAYGRHRC